MENLKILDLAIVVNKIMVDETIIQLRTESKQKKAVPFSLVKASLPNGPINAVPVVDIKIKQIPVNARAAAENLSPKPIYSFTINAKLNNPLNERFRHTSIEKVEKKRYRLFYDSIFEETLQATVEACLLVIGKNGKYKKSSTKHMVFLNKLRKNAKKMQK